MEVVGLAVREEVSRLDGEYRFLEGGRWTPPELHDLPYRMMPETIRVLAGSPAVQRVTITDRTGDDLYVLDKTSDHATDHAAVAAALEHIRARTLSPEDARAWINRQRDTVITYALRGAIDDTSRPTLVRITREDATRVMPMADPRPDGHLAVPTKRHSPCSRLSSRSHFSRPCPCVFKASRRCSRRKVGNNGTTTKHRSSSHDVPLSHPWSALQKTSSGNRWTPLGLQ